MARFLCQHVPLTMRHAWLALLLFGSAACPEERGDAADAGSQGHERAPTWYACAQGLIPFAQVCDGKLDCEGAEDEANCNGTFLCVLEHEPPKVKWGLLPESARCDGVIDCLEAGDDESECPGRKQFVCPGGAKGPHLVTGEQYCDGVLDCPYPDWAHDESDCEDIALCDERVIAKSKVCDGTWDCERDEFNCPGGERFTCTDGRTIPLANKCDGLEQCWDGSDERPAACPHQHRCIGGARARYISLDKICDGQADCPDASEERACVNLFSCGDGLFVRRDRRCDGKSDCPGGQDEVACVP